MFNIQDFFLLFRWRGW